MAKRLYCSGGGPRISAPYRAPIAASRSISASSGGASGWGGTVSDLAGSPISLMPFSKPAGVKMNNSLAGPESTVKAWDEQRGAGVHKHEKIQNDSPRTRDRIYG
jgi:hypothetical protein